MHATVWRPYFGAPPIRGAGRGAHLDPNTPSLSQRLRRAICHHQDGTRCYTRGVEDAQPSSFTYGGRWRRDWDHKLMFFLRKVSVIAHDRRATTIRSNGRGTDMTPSGGRGELVRALDLKTHTYPDIPRRGRVPLRRPSETGRVAKAVR